MTEMVGIYRCKTGHLCRDIDIPTVGLDLYCPYCRKPLDCVGELIPMVASQLTYQFRPMDEIAGGSK